MFFTDISQHEINGTNHMRAATALPEETQNGKLSNTHTMLKSTLKMLLVEDGGGEKEKQELRISWEAENKDEHWDHWGREEV